MALCNSKRPSHDISNGWCVRGSAGSLSNQMYRNIHTQGGVYTSYSGRKKKRFTDKSRGVCLSKKWQFWELGMVGEKAVK